MTVGRICRREVDVIEAGALVRTAAQRMAARNVGTLLVVDGKRHVKGLVTDRDVVLRLVAAGRDPLITRVSDIMTPEPLTVSEDTSVEDALMLMRSRSVRRLPVLGIDGVVAGVVSIDDILLLFAQEFGDLSQLLKRSSPELLAHSPPWSDAP